MKPVSLTSTLKFSPLIVFATLFSEVNPVLSQASNIVPDNTLGSESSQVIENVNGQTIEVITGGAVREKNLFHSFQEFNVSEGREAYFNSPNADIQNIFSRVTGNNPSEIMGVLGTFGASNPSLYLINPNGIIFGANSSLVVGGSFTATTADGIRFGQQGEFSTINPQAPQLLTINPSAYLFNQIGDQINGIQSQGMLLAPQTKNLILLGGDIELVNSTLFSLGSTIELGSVRGIGEIGIAEDLTLNFPSTIILGNIFLSASSIVNSEDKITGNSGDILITAKTLEVRDNSFLSTGIFINGNGGDIRINASDSVFFDNQSNAFSSVDSLAQGNAGNIIINTKNLQLSNDAKLIVNNFGIGEVGEIIVNAANSILFNNQSGITTGLGKNAVGKGGGISITTNNLELSNRAFIAGNTSGIGNGGRINLNASKIALNNQSNIGSAVLGTGIGNGGLISLNTEILELGENSFISADTFGMGNAGNITINALDSISINDQSILGTAVGENITGKGGEIFIDTDKLNLSNNSFISADTFGTGNAGNINLTTSESINVDTQSTIATSVGETGTGKGGEIFLTTNMLNITNNSIIGAETFGLGEAGSIEINTNNILLENSQIATTSITEKPAGTIIINSIYDFKINNGFIISNSAQSTGGIINVTAQNISLRENSNIRTNVNRGISNGGNITLTANSIIAFDDSDIFAFAADGQGGNITLDTSAFFGENFTLNSLIEIENRDLLEGNSRVDLNATGAVSGTVSIPDVSFIQNSFTELPNNSIDTDELVANSCVVPAGNRERGTFIITGSESLPVRPGDNLPSQYPTGEVRNLPENNDNSWQPGDPIIEPQGVYRLTNGKLVLSRECQ
jgi:filamentous hemagglutinin family protein